MPLLIPSLESSVCKSKIILFGATYSCAAKLIDLEMKSERKGISIMFGSIFL